MSRIACACQLDRIPTATFSKTATSGARNTDNPWPMLGAPKDQWELGERIHCL